MGRHGENIRQRNDGRWEGRYKTFDKNKGKDIYRSVYGRVYEEVREKLSKARLGLLSYGTENREEKATEDCKNNHSNRSAVQFSKIAEEWLEEIAKKRKYSTYIKYNTVYENHLAQQIGSCEIFTISAADLQEKISNCLSEEGLSESLQKSICCVVNQVLEFAGKKYSVTIPLLEKRQVKQKKKVVGVLSREEQSRLFSVLYREIDKFNAAVLLCLYTGLRLGELCALQWTDFDFLNMTLTVRRTVQRIAVKGYMTRTILMETDPKSENSKRTIPVTGEMMDLLTRLNEGQLYVFGGNGPMEPRTMQYHLKRILNKAGVNSKNFHILRHTFATNCVENGMDVKALSEILGHSDVKITLNWYVHPTMESKQKQIRMLLDFYGQICGQAA